MKKRISRIVAVIVSLMMAFGLTACQGSGNSSDASSKAPAASGASSSSSSGGEKIVRMTGSFPLQTDPAKAFSAVDCAAMFNVYDAIVFAEADGTITGNIAESWKSSEDGLTHTFHIRDGVKFHDGSSVEAEDVAWSFNRMLAIGQGYAYLWEPYVEKAEATDKSTVVVTMKKSFGPFISTLVRMNVLNKDLVTQHLASGDYGDYGDYGSAWLLTADAGSGPYTITAIEISSNCEAKKFDDYWKGWGENAPDKIQFISVEDAATLKTLMKNKQIEISDEWQSQETLKELKGYEGISVAAMSTGAMVDLEMNTKKAPTDDIHFRKALAYLLDYETCRNSIFSGAKAAVGPVASAYEGHDDSLTTYEYNIDKAKEELAQSKYANELDKYPINIVWSSSVADEEKVCLTLQQACSQVGITLNIENTPWATMMEQAASIDTSANISIMLPSDSYGEAGSVLNLRYHSDTTGTTNQFEWLQDANIDSAIEDALTTMDKDQRLAKYKDIQKKIVELCPTIWGCEWPEMRAYQSGYLKWPEAELAASGGKNAPILGRSMYCRTMEFIN